MLATATTAATASTPGILTALLILPLVGAFLIARFRKEQEKQIKATAVFFAVIVFVASLYLPFAPAVSMGEVNTVSADGTATPVFHGLSADRAALEFQGFEHVVLLDSPEITWCVGVDGISLWLVLLTAFLTPLVMLASYEHIKDHVKEYFVCFLVLEAGMIGALIALDLVVFYAFFELMLIPMYLIIGIWGHDRRIFAAVKFFIYTMVGSLLMFVAVIACYSAMPEGEGSFNLIRMYQHLNLGPGPQFWVFLAFALSFGIKVPIFPFHTWLPDAHVEAPTGGSVILAGVLLKMGTYGFIRFALPLFPWASWYFAPLLLLLGVIGIVFAAWMAWVQDDLKKLVAYSSVSHLGFAMLGIFAVCSLAPSPHKIIGLEGATFIGISHGLTAAALFMLVGIIYNRRHTRLIDEFGGLAKSMPWFAACFMIATLGSVGLPGTSGFVGEFAVLLGTFNMQDTFGFLFFSIDFWWFAVVGGLGVIFGAVYMLSVYRRVFFGAFPDGPDGANANTPDMNRLDKVALVPILALILVLGFFPNLLLPSINRATENLDEMRHQRLQEFAAAYPDQFNDDQLTKIRLPWPDPHQQGAPVDAHADHDHSHDHGDAGHGPDHGHD